MNRRLGSPQFPPRPLGEIRRVSVPLLGAFTLGIQRQPRGRSTVGKINVDTLAVGIVLGESNEAALTVDTLAVGIILGET